MINLGRFIWASLVVLSLMLVMLVNGQIPCGANNPQCYNNVTPYTGHGPASNLPSQLCNDCSGDSRRVVVVRINSSWDNSPGQTNSNILAAVQCAGNSWNSTTDGASPPNKTGYRFVVDQDNLTGVSPADITIIKEDLPNNGKAANDLNLRNPTDPNRKNEISLDPVNGNLGGGSFTSSDLCGRVSHELGHLIGLDETTGECNSAMSRTNPDGTRDVDSVQQVDVAQVNKNFNNATRLSCTGYSLIQSAGDEGETPCLLSCPIVDGSRYIPNPECTGCMEDPNEIFANVGYGRSQAAIL